MLSRSKKVPLRKQMQYFQKAQSSRAAFGVIYFLKSDETQVSVVVQKQRFPKATRRNEIKRLAYREVERVWDMLKPLRSQIVLMIQSPQHLTGESVLEAAKALHSKRSSGETA